MATDIVRRNEVPDRMGQVKEWVAEHLKISAHDTRMYCASDDRLEVVLDQDAPGQLQMRPLVVFQVKDKDVDAAACFYVLEGGTHVSLIALPASPDRDPECASMKQVLASRFRRREACRQVLDGARKDLKLRILDGIARRMVAELRKGLARPEIRGVVDDSLRFRCRVWVGAKEDFPLYWGLRDAVNALLEGGAKIQIEHWYPEYEGRCWSRKYTGHWIVKGSYVEC